MSYSDKELSDKVRLWGYVKAITQNLDKVIPQIEDITATPLLEQAKTLISKAESELAKYSRLPSEDPNKDVYSLYMESPLGDRHLISTHNVSNSMDECRILILSESQVDLMERDGVWPEGFNPVLVGNGKEWLLSDNWEIVNG